MADETTRRPKKKTPARSTSSRTAKASATPARSKTATRTTSSSSRTTTKAKAATSASPKKSSTTATAKPKKAGTTRTKKKSTLVTGDAAPRPKSKSAPRPSGARSKSADKAVQKGPGKPTGKSLTIRKTTPASSVARAVKAAKAPSVTGLVEKPKKTKKKAEKTVVSTPTEVRRESARQLATWVAVAGMEKKADRIEVIDLHEKADYADFLVLMSGRSDRQVQSIATGVDEAMRERGHRSQGMEGLSQGHWVLVDFGDVIVHVFLEEARKYYDIESLWMDAGRVPFEGVLLPPPKPKANPDEGPSTLP